jgi:hypothetical protein
MNQWMREQWRQGGMADPTEIRRRLTDQTTGQERDDKGDSDKPTFNDLIRAAAGVTPVNDEGGSDGE